MKDDWVVFVPSDIFIRKEREDTYICFRYRNSAFLVANKAGAIMLRYAKRFPEGLAISRLERVFVMLTDDELYETVKTFEKMKFAKLMPVRSEMK